MLHVIILAAGVGQRMRSNTPKVMHKVAGIPMLQHVINTACELNPEQIHVVISPNTQKFIDNVSNTDVSWVIQNEQLGTAHAVQQPLAQIPSDADVIILYADTPLLQASTLQPLVNNLKTYDLSLLVAKLDNPFGLGRILRTQDNSITKIVEEKDATDDQKLINEIYTGICSVKARVLKDLLPKISNNNAQKEYYLTDIVTLAVHSNLQISSVTAPNNQDILGVNNRAQLQVVERGLQKRLAHNLMLEGVTLADSERIDIRGQLSCAQDVYIDINNVFIGKVSLGNNVTIEPNCVLTNVSVADNSTIKANSVLEGCIIGENCDIGPFARLRPGTKLDNNCKIGNFVEVKNTSLAEGSKASHLSYLGDAQIGKLVNVGAGTITCNYDGVNKHKTIIEDGVFIGSDTQLVAPVTIGKNATIGAGSTIRRNVPAEELTLTASKQKVIYGWKRPEKKK